LHPIIRVTEEYPTTLLTSKIMHVRTIQALIPQVLNSCATAKLLDQIIRCGQLLVAAATALTSVLYAASC
jgi:hypothetical protein